MSILTLTDIKPVLLTCYVKPDSILEMFHDHDSLLDCELVIGLERLEHTELAVADFLQDGIQYRINGHTLEKDGTMTPWPRTESGVCLPELAPREEDLVLEAQLTAIGYDDTSAASMRVQAGRLQRISQCRVRVRVGNSTRLPY